MTHVISTLSAPASRQHHPFAGMGQALDGFWQGLTRRLFNGYRPERHYMRGPGPAWRAKHGRFPAA
jgi:hypothetical protein